MVVIPKSMIMKKNKLKSYLLAAFPFLGTFLVYSIDIDFYGVDQLDKLYFLYTNMLNFF